MGVKEQKILLEVFRRMVKDIVSRNLDGQSEDYDLMEIILKQGLDEEVEHANLYDIDWNIVLELSLEHKVFPLVYKYIKKYIPEQYQETYNWHHFYHLINTSNKIKELQNILKEAEKNKVNVILIKGIALSKLIYNDFYARLAGDIDILVKEEDMLKMEKIMLNLGYERDFDSNKKLSELYKEKILSGKISTIYKDLHDSHEVSYIKDINDMFTIQVEIKRATSSIPKKYIEDFFESTQIIDINNYQVSTLNPLNTLIHLISNAYENTEHSLFYKKNINLRDYCDLYLYINKYKENIDWDTVSERVANYESMTQKIIYIFHNLNQLFENAITKCVLEKFTVDVSESNPVPYGSIVKWENDFLERLFSDKKNIRCEFMRLFKKRCYSQMNGNYNNIYYLNDSNYHSFKDEKYEAYSYKYRISSNGNKIKFSVHLSQELTKDLDKFGIIFTLMDNGTHNDIAYKNIFIRRERDKITSLFSQNNFAQEHIEEYRSKDVEIINKINNELELIIVYTFEELFIDISKSNNILCYNTALQEEVLPNYYQLIGVKFPQLNLGIMKIPS
nr:nucleotidyltransferase family protein [Paenibacillus bovis]